MKYINVIDAKEQFSYLVNLLCDPQEEVYLTFGGKPIIKMTPITENLPRVEEKNPALNPEHKSEYKPDPRRIFGIAKGTFTFDDKLFDDMDEEIDKMFFGEEKK